MTRAAEVMTVFSLMAALHTPLLHVGRPWRDFWVFPYDFARGVWPNIRSPFVWDPSAVGTYLIGSSLFVFIALLPDLANVRDRATKKIVKTVYGFLCLGWRGTPQQWHSLERGIGVMAVVIIPVAVSVHTIVSWDFAMSLTPMWHSTIFGPYFVVGAIYSGIAVLMVAMFLLRTGLRLQHYLDDRVFNNLGLLFVTMTLLWTYFTYAEHLTIWYGDQASEIAVFNERVWGSFAPFFWTMLVLNAVIPLAVLPFRWGRRPAWTAAVGICVLIGMWLERYLIVVGSLSVPRLEFTVGHYQATWVEWGIFAGSFGLFGFLYFLFLQSAPIVSIWEMREGEKHAGEPLTSEQPSLRPLGGES